jgi:glucokinase
MSDRAAIGIDIGGTKIAVGAVSEDGRLEHRTEIATAGATLNDVVAVAERTHGTAVGVGICELVGNDGQVRSAASIQWTTRELRAKLSDLGPVTVEADVRAAAVAEARFGAGRRFSSFVYLTVGTGISHCLVLDGEPYRGARGFAQLSGSGTVSFRCPHCGERVRLSVEDVASGAAFVRDGAVDTAALGSLVALLVNVLDPEAVIVGGGLGSATGAYWNELVSATRAHIWADAVRGLPIVQAGLGADSGVIGAGWLVLRAADREVAR